MNGDLFILIFVVTSIALITLLKTHVAFVILALCGGYVLSQFLGESLTDFFATWVDPNSFPLSEIVNLVLIALPAVLIAYRFRFTQRGVSRLIQQLVPALALTMLAIVFVLSTLPENSANRLYDDSYLARMIEDFDALLVVFALSTALFDVLLKHANEPLRRHRGPGRPRK